RPDKGERDSPEALPDARSVHGGRVEELALDRLKAGEDRDGEERRSPPDVRDDDRGHRPAALAEPVDTAVREAAVHDRPVEDAEGRVEEPQPGDGRERGWHDPRQEQRGAREVLEAEGLVHEDGEGDTEPELED